MIGVTGGFTLALFVERLPLAFALLFIFFGVIALADLLLADFFLPETFFEFFVAAPFALEAMGALVFFFVAMTFSFN
jgi:hypothetical protein